MHATEGGHPANKTQRPAPTRGTYTHHPSSPLKEPSRVCARARARARVCVCVPSPEAPKLQCAVAERAGEVPRRHGSRASLQTFAPNLLRASLCAPEYPPFVVFGDVALLCPLGA